MHYILIIPDNRPQTAACQFLNFIPNVKKTDTPMITPIIAYTILKIRKNLLFLGGSTSPSVSSNMVTYLQLTMLEICAIKEIPA